jgi:hypothetical protein
VCLTADASGGLKSHSARDPGPISEGGGNASPAREDGRYGEAEGMERLVRHNGESRETDRPTWSHHRRFSGGQGACREAGSERLEENHRVVINGSNPDR